MATSLQRPLARSFACSSRSTISKLNANSPARVFSRSKTTIASEAQKDSLPWAEYLAIRKGKRRWEMALTIPCMAAGFIGGATYFGSLEMDATKPIMGIDPLFFFGGATLSCIGVGYLIGPIIGSSLWRMTHRSTIPLIEARDREFHKHIVKNRVDPTAQSATNPVPDFYGEKIGSLHGYRQWLRDQAKYRRKSEWPEDQ